MESNLAAIGNGFVLSMGLIIAIGPQNAYVIRKGLVKRHVFLVATACFLGDVVLILLGAGGVGALLVEGEPLALVVTALGVMFLLWYGWKSLKDAITPHPLTPADIEYAGKKAHGKGWVPALLMALALTFFNPHAYIDTLIILGGVAAHYTLEPRLYFTLGAIAASGFWFYGLGFGAGFFSKTFENPKAWRVMDLLVWSIMWGAAGYLAWTHFGMFL